MQPSSHPVLPSHAVPAPTHSPTDRRAQAPSPAVVSHVAGHPLSAHHAVHARTVPARQVSPVAANPALHGGFLELMPALQRAVAEEGYTKPTPIQTQAIPPLLAGRDLLGCAQTGTGKTAAFALPMLQHLAQQPGGVTRSRPRALIMAPTRELAAQIGDSLRAYGKYLRLTHTVIFGGVGQGPQVSALRHGVDIVIATPGRLLDLMHQRCVRLDGVEIFVLDEADRMLDMGFIHDVRKVIAALPAHRQSLFFSATLTSEVVTLSRSMVRDPVHVTITPDQPAVERIQQKVMFVEKGDKDALLSVLLRDPKIKRVLVFTQMKHMANRVVEKLAAAGIAAEAIHGNKSQSARTQALAGFKAGRVRVLVATDLAARGIDVDDITHVINYDLPLEPETYVHRIGRTARAGAEGDAVAFCCAHDREMLRTIERLIRQTVPVDTAHDYHSEMARLATGSAARPPPKGRGGGGGGRGGGGGGGGRGRPSGPGGTRSFGGGGRFRR